MTAEGWKGLIIQAVEHHYSNDSSDLDKLIELIIQSEQAKQNLRNAGFGVTGVDLLGTVNEAIDYVQKCVEPLNDLSEV